MQSLWNLITVKLADIIVTYILQRRELMVNNYPKIIQQIYMTELSFKTRSVCLQSLFLIMPPIPNVQYGDGVFYFYFYLSF